LSLEETEEYNLFLASIKSPATMRAYSLNFKKYVNFIGQNDIFFHKDAGLIEQKIIDFIINMKEQEGLLYKNIKNYLARVLRFYKVNRISLNSYIINTFLPEETRGKKDRAYTHEEISKLLEFAEDPRMKVVILLMATSGMRVGALPDLRLRNLEKRNDVYKITVYELTNDEYNTFCTPECAKAIDSYKEFRKRYGEELRENTFLIREQFNIRDKLMAANHENKKIKASTLMKRIIDISERAGIRTRNISPFMRHDVAVDHGFRKFFTSQLVEADLKTELRWLLEGHKLKGNDSHYVRVSEKRLQQEYEKAIDNLTIDPSNRLKRKMETLTIEKSKLESLESRVNGLLTEKESFKNDLETFMKRLREEIFPVPDFPDEERYRTLLSNQGWPNDMESFFKMLLLIVNKKYPDQMKLNPNSDTLKIFFQENG